MKDNKSIAEQVAELTEQQQKNVVRVGIWGTVIMVIVFFPLLALLMLGAITMVTDPLLMTREAFVGWWILAAIIFVLLTVYLIVVKVAFPYYNDRKAMYILKNRKKEK